MSIKIMDNMNKKNHSKANNLFEETRKDEYSAFQNS